MLMEEDLLTDEGGEDESEELEEDVQTTPPLVRQPNIPSTPVKKPRTLFIRIIGGILRQTGCESSNRKVYNWKTLKENIAKH